MCTSGPLNLPLIGQLENPALLLAERISSLKLSGHKKLYIHHLVQHLHFNMNLFASFCPDFTQDKKFLFVRRKYSRSRQENEKNQIE